jgi:hypothetical protein
MTVIVIAIAIYILGVAAVLFFRPAFMFNEQTGTWKEFGLAKSEAYTLLPFWMFVILWAIVSYVGGTYAAIFFGGLALQSLPSDVVEANLSNVLKPISKSVPSIPVSAVEAAKSPSSTAPGYYILETPKSGPPKYIYFGTSPPSELNVERVTA